MMESSVIFAKPLSINYYDFRVMKILCIIRRLHRTLYAVVVWHARAAT